MECVCNDGYFGNGQLCINKNVCSKIDTSVHCFEDCTGVAYIYSLFH